MERIGRRDESRQMPRRAFLKTLIRSGAAASLGGLLSKSASGQEAPNSYKNVRMVEKTAKEGNRIEEFYLGNALLMEKEYAGREEIASLCLYSSDGKPAYSYDSRYAEYSSTDDCLNAFAHAFACDYPPSLERLDLFRNHFFRYKQEPPKIDHWKDPDRMIASTDGGQMPGDCEDLAHLLCKALNKKDIPAYVIFIPGREEESSGHAACGFITQRMSDLLHVGVCVCNNGIFVNNKPFGDIQNVTGCGDKTLALMTALENYLDYDLAPPGDGTIQIQELVNGMQKTLPPQLVEDLF